MKKVFLIHGFEGEPNGGWRPWLMGELAKVDVWACSLAMPKPNEPKSDEWTEEIVRAVGEPNIHIFIVGHSLGVPAILNYLQKLPEGPQVGGVVLVSGPAHKNDNRKIDSFFEVPFDFKLIKSKAKHFAIIHGDNDPLVPISDAQELSEKLGGELVFVPNGGHLNGSAGWRELPQALEALKGMTN